MREERPMNKPILRKKILIFAVLLAYSHALFSSDGRTVILTGPDGTQIEGVITPNGNFCVGNACVPVDFCEGACDGYLVNSYEPSEGEGLFPAVGSDTGNPDTGGFGTGSPNTTPKGGGGRIDNSWEATFGQNTTDIFASRQAALDQSLKNMEAEWNSIGKDIGNRIMGNDPNPFSIDTSEITGAVDAQIQQTQQAVVAYILAYSYWYEATTRNMEATRDKIEEMNKETEARLDENLTTKVPVKIEERNKLWKDLDAAKTQTKAKAGGVITALESGTLVTQGSGGFASSPASVGGDKVRRLDKYLSSVQRSLEGEGPLSPQRTAIIDDAKLSNMQADSAYAKGDTETGDALVRIGYALGDVAIALSPIVVAALAPEAAVAIAVVGAVAIGKSWYEARTGTRIWDGSALSVMDRQLAYLDVAFAMLPGTTKALGYLSDLLTAGKSADDSRVITAGVNAVEELVDSAKKIGIEAKDISAVTKEVDHLAPGKVADIYESAAKNAPLGLGSTGRSIPNSLQEQAAMLVTRADPQAGEILPLVLTDSRWPATDGWQKMQTVFKTSEGRNVVIHYVRNKVTGMVDDFKFKD